ncbi:MAG: T9SS type A sorting domain-containing protein [Candidatus Marinimicrobia bacterium]|nr:T9SS type A sorting domain-containing protein [Candidatus Neomarinimicrobiota bacterium]
MKNATTTVLTIGLIAAQCFSQPLFERHPLVQLPGYNTNFKISRSQAWEEEPVYLCWENTLDSSVFSIYRMVVDPILGTPQLITSSNNILSSPDVTLAGDVVWEEWIGGTSIIKYYSSSDDSISTLTDEVFNSTKPNISRSLMIYIQEDTLKFLNLANQLTHNIDFGGISNPDIALDMYTSYIEVTYEKSIGDAHYIRTASKFAEDAEYYYTDYGEEHESSNPRFGTIDWLSYQTIVDSSWSIVVEWGTLIRPYDTTNPFIVSTGIITVREVAYDLVLFESDSIPDNREIFCSQPVFDQYSIFTNISNMPGDDYNPQAFYTYLWDSVAVVWEHEVENGRELWWAKDTFRVPVAIDPELNEMPASFLVINAYPNPFNPSTTIRYGLPQDSNVSLVIYDVRGQIVQTIASGHQTAGWYDVVWNGQTADGKTISTGIYFVRLVAGEYSQVIKMLYLK